MLKSLGTFEDHQDGSLKSVFRDEENKIIEVSLLFNKPTMDVVCVPTHHFCNLGCKMCHLTNNKLNKKMIPIQYSSFEEALLRSLVDEEGHRLAEKKRLLISFMGVGEPLLNLELIEALFKEEEKIKALLGYEKISYAISTMMPNDNVKKLTSLVMHYQKPLKLHFSLHTPIDEDRRKLIPSTRLSVEEALNLLVYYRTVIQTDETIMDVYKRFHRTDDPIEIHYTLIKEVNDSEKELESLIHLLRDDHIPIKFIRFNPKSGMKESECEEQWVESIRALAGVRVKTYSPPGKEIGSSCGEFTKHYYHEEIETEEEKETFLNWKKEHEVVLNKSYKRHF